jgi:hypothetical protein
MDSKGTKRIRTNGREQLLLDSPELHTRLGKKFCAKAELLPLLISHGLVRRSEVQNDQLFLGSLFSLRYGRLEGECCEEAELLPLLLSDGFALRVHTIEIEVRPLGGDSFNVTMDTAQRTVSELKLGIARIHSTPVNQQELYMVAVRADGGAVREDDAEPALLEDEAFELVDGEVVALSVKEQPLEWRTSPAHITISKPEQRHISGSSGRYNESVAEFKYSEDGGPRVSHGIVTTGIELTEGEHYWEVYVTTIGEGTGIEEHAYLEDSDSDNDDCKRGTNGEALYDLPELNCLLVGVCQPNLDGNGDCEAGWFVNAGDGSLGRRLQSRWQILRAQSSATVPVTVAYTHGDRVGMLLNLDSGSLRFFRNGVPNGMSFPAGSVTGPVVHAAKFSGCFGGERVGLLPVPPFDKPGIDIGRPAFTHSIYN